MMTNVHEFAESPRPTTNMIRYVGGMTIYPPKALSKVLHMFVPFRNTIDKIVGDFFQELNDLLNLRRTNVLFSMGTFALSKDMPVKLKTGSPFHFSCNHCFLGKR